MRLCLISSEHDPYGGLGGSVQRLARLLASEHEVTVLHAFESAAPAETPGDRDGVRHVAVDLSRLPPVAFACDDHARSAALVEAIEAVYGDRPPDYLEAPDYRGLALLPLQARNAGNPSLRGCAIALRLRGSIEAICLHDRNWNLPAHRILFDLEREALRLADVVVWPGGDVLGVYRRFLGFDLPVTERVRLPADQPLRAPEPAPRPGGGPLRILYAGRLQRVKGVLALIEACTRLDSDDWSLTMIGGDTDTAPLGRSMRDTIETACAGDPRLSLLDRVSSDELRRSFAVHDLLVAPSKFDVWPNVVLEAMAAGLPVLATPVGGLTEIVEHGVTGWHTAGLDREAIGDVLGRLLDDREELERVRASGEVFRRFERLTAPGPILAAYGELLKGLRKPVARRVPQAHPEPLVTGVVPYYREHEWVGEAVDSLLCQTHRNLEVTIVSDGAFGAEDAVLQELAENPRVRVLTQCNEGDQIARNLGILDAAGKYIAMLDADNLFEPTLVERAVAMLEADPMVAYVTCWLRFFGAPEALDAVGTHGYPPLGNGVRSDNAFNSDGDSIAILPRRLFAELGYRYDEEAVIASDWALYRVLKDDGRFGAVIPERLARYRVRADSLSRGTAPASHTRAWEEVLSLRLARKVQWMAAAR